MIVYQWDIFQDANCLSNSYYNATIFWRDKTASSKEPSNKALPTTGHTIKYIIDTQYLDEAFAITA